MNPQVKSVIQRLDRLRHWEKLEDISARYKTPYILEYELSAFRTLYHRELKASLGILNRAISSREDAKALAYRGRIRRVIGDANGAARDLRRALDLAPDCAEALAWLGELDLAGPQAEANLSQAIAKAPELGWAYLYRGSARLLAGRLREASTDLSEARRRDPTSALAAMMSGLVHERFGRRRDAAQAFKTAAGRHPSCAAFFFLWSRAETGAKSIRACEGAVVADGTYALTTLSQHRPPRTWNAYLMWLRRFACEEPERAGLYYRQEDIHYSPFQLQEYEDAMALCRERPGSAWAEALAGRCALRAPPDPVRLRAGSAALARARRLAPEIGWIHAWCALAEIKAGRPKAALADFDLGLKLQPFYHRAYAWRGALLRRMGKIREAMDDLDRALAMDDQYAFAIHERSLARRAAGDFAGAAADLDRAFLMDTRYQWVFSSGHVPSRRESEAGLKELDRGLAQNSRSASLYAWRGQLRAQRLEFPQALRDFERAEHLEPWHSLAQGWHGRALLDQGRPSAAAVKLKRAVELEPRALIFQGWLAEAAFESGSRREAFAVLERVLNAKPRLHPKTLWWAYLLRGQFHLRLQRPGRAIKDIEYAMRYASRRVENYFWAAKARLALEDYAGAEREVEKALVISPRYGRAYLLRASIREKQGRFQEVVDDYRTVQERFPFLLNEEQKSVVAGLLR
jgi:tetratricopeptide (TPR) repeat protein